MAYDFSGTGQYINTASGTAPVNTEPLTLACWMAPDNSTASQEVFNVSATSVNAFALNSAGAVASDPMRIYKGNGGSYAVADSSTSMSFAAFLHSCGVFTSSTSRTVYLNGGGKVTNTTSLSTAGGSYRIDLAILQGSSLFDGRVAEAAVWGAALTDDEVTSLAKGFRPWRVRPQSLLFYVPLIRTAQDVRGGLSLTTTGSPAVSDHPRRYG